MSASNATLSKTSSIGLPIPPSQSLPYVGKSFPMRIRSSVTTVTFRKPFSLGGFDDVMAPGAYHVVTDEEFLENLSPTAYRRVRTAFHLSPETTNPNFGRSLIIDPDELAAALLRDAENDENVGEAVASQQSRTAEAAALELKTDHQAEDRADDEGMFVQDFALKGRQLLLRIIAKWKRLHVSSAKERPEPTKTS